MPCTRVEVRPKRVVTPQTLPPAGPVGTPVRLAKREREQKQRVGSLRALATSAGQEVGYPVPECIEAGSSFRMLLGEAIIHELKARAAVFLAVGQVLAYVPSGDAPHQVEPGVGRCRQCLKR